MHDIFLSYNRQDQDRARLFAEAFAGEGLSVWWDVTLRSGESYDEVTEAALRGAMAVVVLWSPRSVVSRWVRAEATLADRCRTLMPAMIEPCERPIMFELTQTAELGHWDGDKADTAWCSFLDDVQRLIARNREASADPATAAEQLSPVLVATAQPAPQRKHAAKRPTLAILPFANRSGAADDDDLVEVMGEDITAALSQGRGLRVLAHGIMAAYRGQVIDVRKIGSVHGADYVMEGNVRRLGGALRVSAQLVDGHSGAILWTQKFDRPSSERFALLDDLVEDVSGHLGVQIQRIEFDRAVKKTDEDTPWAAIKRSWARLPRGKLDGLRLALVDARHAVELAPDYALAASNLALILGLLYQRRGSVDPELLTEAQQEANRALYLNGSHGTVLLSCAFVKYFAQEWEESLRLAERSVEVNPNMPDALHALAGALIPFERYDEALEMLDRADHDAPNGYGMSFSLINRCWALYGSRRIDEALDAAIRLLKVMPVDLTGLIMRATLHAERDEWDQARSVIADLRRAHPEDDLELLNRFILHSRQAEPARQRNASLFRQVWEQTPPDQPATPALSQVTG